MKIDGLGENESRHALDALFAHVLDVKYRYVHHWSVGEVLLWEHIGTWHYAVPDYRPDEHRLMKRCQFLADSVFDPDFVRAAMGEHAPSAQF